MIENLAKGAVRDPEDLRDFKAEQVFGAVTVDFTKGGNRYQKIKKWREQWSSLSCTGQGTAYIKDIIDGYPDDAASARSIYSFVYLYGGGANIRDAVLRVLNPGVAHQSQAPDPDHASEQDYRKNDDIILSELNNGLEKNAFVLPDKSIDYVAWGIENYGGVVFGLEGNNAGWANLSEPRPPGQGETIDWGHCLGAVDYHLHDGVKCIICASSWTITGGIKYHHIKQDYFDSGLTFNPWVIIPKGTVRMLVFFQVKGLPTIWALVDGEWCGFADMPAFTGYQFGRPFVIVELDQAEFDKVKSNPEVFKS